MAGPGGREVGRVSVKVLPDTSNFAKSLQAYLQRVETRLRVNLPVSLDAGDVARTEAELSALSRDRKVNLDVDTNALDRAVKSLNKAASGDGRRGGGIFGIGVGEIVAVTAAVGALGAILPAIVASIGAPIAAIGLGLEGIKQAAGELAAPFAELRSVLSDTFVTGLRPVFRDLAGLFPVLTAGLDEVARSLIGLFSRLTAALTSDSGLANLSAIFTSISVAVDALGPAMAPLVDSFLILARVGAQAFAALAPALAQVIIAFNTILTQINASGFLTLAMKGFAAILIGVVVAIGAVVLAVTLFVGALTGLVQAVARVVSAIVGFARSVPGQVRGALSSLLGVITGIITGAWNAGRSAFQAGINKVVSLARSIPSKIKSAVGNLGNVLVSAGKAVIQGLINGIQSKFNALKSKLSAVGAFIKAHKGPPSKDKLLLVNAGRLIMDGLIRGMESRLPAIESTLHGITSNIQGTSASLAFAAGTDFDTSSHNLELLHGVATLHPDSTVTIEGVAQRVVTKSNLAGAMAGRGL